MDCLIHLLRICKFTSSSVDRDNTYSKFFGVPTFGNSVASARGHCDVGSSLHHVSLCPSTSDLTVFFYSLLISSFRLFPAKTLSLLLSLLHKVAHPLDTLS